MKIFNKLFLLAFLLPSFSIAQSHYKPGYIITLKGDTLRGFIDYKEWDNNPKFVAFKNELNQANPEIFTTNAANAFAITGQEYYEKYTLPVSQDPVEVSNMGMKLDTNYHIDTIFLRIINKGSRVTLYSYKDNVKQRFYLLEAGQTQPYELIYHAYYNRDESETIQYVKRFHTQLQNVAQKNGISSDHLSSEISQSNYSETDLNKIVQRINGNTSNQFSTRKMFGTRWFAGAGVNYSQSKFTGIINFANSPTSNSISPKIDAGIDFFVNKDIQKFYFRAEVSFTINGTYKFTTNDVGQAMGTATLKYKQYNTSIIPQCVYNLYNNDKLKVFIDAGIAFNLAAYNNYQTVTVYDSFPTLVQNKYPELSKTYWSIPAKAGLVFNKMLEVYVCYIPSASITDFTPSKNGVTSYQAGINYLFGGK